nr:riboflavin biosynthesis protein RibF [Shouchella shacheensis]
MALGYFDGVHKGHRTVIETAKNIASECGLQSAVMTFHPHPKEVLANPKEPMRYLTPMQEKEARIRELDVDVLYEIHFTRGFSHLTPQQFVDQFIVGLSVLHVVAGFDFTYGVKGEGDMERLSEYAKGRFMQTTVEKVTKADDKISSTRIRHLLTEGDVGKIEELLGTPYSIRGTVAHGDKRGRQIGFPTANVQLDDRYMIPRVGVYVATLEYGGVLYQGMANVGFKPTFVETAPEPSIEVNIFDFDQQIYDQQVKVTFLQRIRSEQKFNGIEEIKAQLGEDQRQAKAFFLKRS